MSLKGRHEPAALAVRQPESGHSSEMPRADFGQCELSAKTPLYGQFPKVTVRLHPSIPKPSLALQQIEVCGASIVYAPLRACWSPNAPTDDIASLDPAMGVA